MLRIESLGAWPSRVAWLMLALVAGEPFGRALQGRSTPVVLVVAVALWAGWAAGLVALLVPRSTSLTAVRILVPAGLAAVVAALVVSHNAAGSNDPGVLDVLAVAAATVAVVSALAPWVAAAFVDGSAYGPERRSPLRTPAVVLLLAMVTWTLVVAGITAGPLLLAAGQWWLGAGAVLVGAGAVVAGVRALHQLARRWVVVVPAGLVLQDPLSMPEPQLFLRQGIRHLGPARAVDDQPNPDAGESGSTERPVVEDLTAGASGLALELVLTEPVEVLVRSSRSAATTRTVDLVLFTPVRPASVLAQAQERRIPVA